MLTAATRGGAFRTRSAERMRRHPCWWWLAGLAIGVAVANFVVLLAQAGSLVAVLYTNADNASVLVLPALASHVPAGSVINLGNHAWYEPWLFLRATVGLPGYREIWEGAPFVASWLGIAVVTACAWSALGRLAALLCAATLLASSEALRSVLYVPATHGLIVLHAGVLCGALLLVYRRARAGRFTPGVALLVGLPLVLFTGVGLTDEVLLVSALAPFILAPLLCWLRLRSSLWREVSRFALLTGAASALVALLLSHLMQDAHVIHARFPITFVESQSLIVGGQNMIAALTSLGGGAFFGASASGGNLLTFAAGALTLIAFAAVLRALWNWGKIESPVQPASPRTGASELFIAYWGLVLVLVLVAFAFTSLSNNPINYRYLIGAWVAVAALLGILATTQVARAVLISAVAAFGVLNLHAELAVGVEKYGVAPGEHLANVISHFAIANGARIGYAGYWDAAPVTWETKLHVQVYPIEPCTKPTGLCKFGSFTIGRWYVPRAGVRTFLITDRRPHIPYAVSSPLASLGTPLAEEPIGEGFTIYVYNHDIAAEISK